MNKKELDEVEKLAMEIASWRISKSKGSISNRLMEYVYNGTPYEEAVYRINQIKKHQKVT